MPNVRIYKLSDPRNNIVMYIGKTVQTLKNRLNGHIHCAKHNFTPRDIWIAELLSINKKPITSLIEDVEEKFWREKEIYWISYYKSINPNLANLSKGGQGPCGVKRGEESSRNMSMIKSKPIYQLDKELNIINEYPSCKVASTITGITHLSKAATNSTKRTAGGYIWVYKSEYKSFLTNKEKKNFIKDKPHFYKKISMYDKKGSLLNTWNSVKEASKETGFKYKSICKAAAGFRKTYRKFIWKYENKRRNIKKVYN